MMLDPNGPGGKPLPLFESGAILIYLAEKTRPLMPQDAAGRYETIQWLMFQTGGIGPTFGQVGFFNKFAGKDYADKRPRPVCRGSQHANCEPLLNENRCRVVLVP